MYALFAQLTRLRNWNRWTPALRAASQIDADGVAHRLMESAEARAGTNPRQAHELREAASAYLSVVR
ncbi:MAG: hypothetical protein AB7I35_15185 [Ramlibacter sp.]|nr:hypothetical protein [Ramlibacter sp.]